MNAKLAECLKKLRLSGMAQTLEVRLQEAMANRLDHAEFLELVLADEMAVRQERLIARGLKAAAFREQKTLEDFHWDFNRSIKKKQIFDMAAGGFVISIATCCWPGLRASGRAIWSRRLAANWSMPGSPCSTARSSTQCATSSTTRHSRGTTGL